MNTYSKEEQEADKFFDTIEVKTKKIEYQTAGKIEKKCSNCLYSAKKAMYVNTVPSIHTCMNKEAKDYLKDNAWSYCCASYQIAPENMIDKDKYEYLKERDLKLTSLEHAGVDNWEGYDYSIDVLEELKKEKL